MIEISHKQAQHLIRAAEDDRRLPDAQWSTLQAHLENCPECRAYAARRAALERALARVLRERWSPYAPGQPGAPAAARAKRPLFFAVPKDFDGPHLFDGPIPPEAAGPADPVAVRPPRFSGRVQAAYRSAGRWRKAGLLAFAALWLALAGAALGFYRFPLWTEPAGESTPIAAASGAAPVGAAVLSGSGALGVSLPPEPFEGEMVFTGLESGNAEIYLFERAGDISYVTNLTDHPGEDFLPAWSPDGQWIAFLSDRRPAGGGGAKPELYVMAADGSGVTQITNRPDVDWQGPLSWSDDGQLIALTGWRRDAAAAPQGQPLSQSFAFLAPALSAWRDGPGARTLASTRGLLGTPLFSPTARLMALITTPDPGRRLVAFDLAEGQFFETDVFASPPAGQILLSENAYAWSPDGRRLAYFIANGAQVELRVSDDLFAGASGAAGESELLYALPAALHPRGLTWLPDRSRRVLAFLADGAEGETCSTVHLLAAGAQSEPRRLEGLCALGALSAASWTSAGQWLVVTARAPGESTPGYYAVFAPQDLALKGAAPFVRLADAAAFMPFAAYMSSAAYMPSAAATPPAPSGEAAGEQVGAYFSPQVRPSAFSFPLQGQPAEAEEYRAHSAASAPPGGSSGTILYSMAQISERGLAGRGMLVNPDGSPFGEPLALDALPACLTLSPDGQHIASIRYDSESTPGSTVPVVVVAPRSGGPPVEFTWSLPANSLPVHHLECPSWSPDGSRLAWLAQPVVLKATLRVVSVAGAGAGQELGLPVDITGAAEPVAWSPDGNRLLAGGLQASLGVLRIYEFDLREAAPFARLKYESDADGELYGLVYSPERVDGLEGPRIAWMVVREGAYDTLLTLYTARTDFTAVQEEEKMVLLDYNGRVRSNALAWLPDGRLVFAVRHRADARYKTDLWRYDLAEGQRRPLAYLEDLIYDMAWSQNGRFLTFSSDGGLFLLDTVLIDAVPTLISPDRAYSVDWK